MWAVLMVLKDAILDVGGAEQVKLPLELMEGMVGAIPVFGNHEDAVTASEDGKYEIMELMRRDEGGKEKTESGVGSGGGRVEAADRNPTTGQSVTPRRRLETRRHRRRES
jgi:hypothetical protein